MSTRKKESVSSEKEKRGTSPSLFHLKSSSKSSKTSTSKSLGSSPSSDKATPNYLKPTLSSSLSSGNATKPQGRRPVSNTESSLKSNLARRRSFEKPPSPTRTSKTRGVSPIGRAGTSPKTERIVKGAREGGKQVQHLYARAVGALKKSAIIGSKSKKAETTTAPSRKEPKDDHHTAEEASDHLESSIVEDEDPLVADQEMEQTQGEIDEDTLKEENNNADSPILSEHPEADDNDAAEVEFSPTMLEQHDDEIGEAESPTTCEIKSGDIVPKAESLTLLGQDDADKAESPVTPEQRDESPTILEPAEQQEMEEDSTNHDDESVAGNPKEDEELAKAEETKAEGEEENAGGRLSHGEKDVALSNDVIEERRNKVKALAGAFETVIKEHKATTDQK